VVRQGGVISAVEQVHHKVVAQLSVQSQRQVEVMEVKPVEPKSVVMVVLEVVEQQTEGELLLEVLVTPRQLRLHKAITGEQMAVLLHHHIPAGVVVEQAQ